MWCKRVRNQLSAYADGELGAVECRQVEAHLTQCADCAQEHASLQSLVRLTTAIPLEDTPSTLHTEIMTRLSVDAPTPRAVPRPGFPMRLTMFNPWMWTAASGAAAALVMGLVQRPAVMPPAPSQPEQPQARRHTETPPRVRTAGSTALRPAEAKPEPSAEPTAPPHVEEPEAVTPTPESVPEVEKAPTAEQSLRVQVARRPAGERLERPQPVDPMIPSKLALEPKTLEPSPAGAPEGKMGTSPEATDTVKMVTGLEMPEITPAMMDKDASTRMAGTPSAGELPMEDDEGVRSLRMFLEERNRTVPQPPLVHPNRMRKL